MKLRLLKLLDTMVGRLLPYLLPAPAQTGLRSSIDTILIIRPGGIGDAVLLLPLVQQLAARYPHATIDVLAERRNAEVFSWSPHVSTVWRYDSPTHLLRVMRGKYDLVIDTEQWYRLSAVVTRLIDPPRSIGFATNSRARLFTGPCSYDLNSYETDSFLSLLHPLGYKPDRSRVDTTEVIRLPLSPYLVDRRYVVLFIGGSVPAKRWPIKRYAQLARYLEQQDHWIIILGGKGDLQVSKAVVGGTKKCLNVTGKTSLTQAAAIVSGAQLMISGDSGLLHVAQLLNVPTVSLFGPSHPRKWSREEYRHIVVSAGADCSPCSRFGTIPKCHHDVMCMQDITVEMVTKAVSYLMEKTGATIADHP